MSVGDVIARGNWQASSLPQWLNAKTYMARILPGLTKLTVSTIALALGVSLSYAADIRLGRRYPHARHWQVLAELVSG
jgi:hypothetical protein